MSRERPPRGGSAGRLTVGSLRGLPQAAQRAAAKPPPRALTAVSTPLPVLDGTALPPSRRRGRCCGTGCAGCPVGEAIRRARARGAG